MSSTRQGFLPDFELGVVVELDVEPVPVVVLVPVVEVELGAEALAAEEGEGSDPNFCFWHGTMLGNGGAWRPEYVDTNLATSIASLPTTMFCGMIAPEKPPFSIAYRTRIAGRSQRTLKLGPLLNSAVKTLEPTPAWRRRKACGNQNSAG